MSLLDFEARTYSQHGEDGIVAEIFRRIGKQPRMAFETGCGDGRQNCTRALVSKGTKARWVEAAKDKAAEATAFMAGAINVGRLEVIHRAATPENVNDLVPGDTGFLVIDIDGNDFWLWRALTRKPDVVCIEYNAHRGPTEPWTIQYDPAHRYGSDTYFGASLKALEMLGRAKGYALVACDSSGTNAFFVLNEHARHFPEPHTSEHHWREAVGKGWRPKSPKPGVVVTEEICEQPTTERTG